MPCVNNSSSTVLFRPFNIMGDDFFVATAAAAAVVIMRMVMEMMEMGISGLKSPTVKPTSRLVKHFEITIIIITTAHDASPSVEELMSRHIVPVPFASS